MDKWKVSTRVQCYSSLAVSPFPGKVPWCSWHSLDVTTPEKPSLITQTVRCLPQGARADSSFLFLFCCVFLGGCVSEPLLLLWLLSRRLRLCSELLHLTQILSSSSGDGIPFPALAVAQGHVATSGGRVASRSHMLSSATALICSGWGCATTNGGAVCGPGAARLTMCLFLR